jgi:hypothetical protein
MLQLLLLMWQRTSSSWVADAQWRVVGSARLELAVMCDLSSSRARAVGVRQQ